mgnify:FL=1
MVGGYSGGVDLGLKVYQMAGTPTHVMATANFTLTLKPDKDIENILGLFKHIFDSEDAIEGRIDRAINGYLKNSQ